MNGFRMYVPPTLRTVALFVLACFVLGVSPVMAQNHTAKTQKKAAPSATTKTKAKATAQTNAQAQQVQAEPGQRVFIDPVTKKMKQPDQSDIDALNAARVQPKGLRMAPAASAKEQVMPNGAVMLPVDESMMMYSVATKSPDGKIATGCVDGKAKAESIGKGTQAIPQGVNNEK